MTILIGFMIQKKTRPAETKVGVKCHWRFSPWDIKLYLFKLAECQLSQISCFDFPNVPAWYLLACMTTMTCCQHCSTAAGIHGNRSGTWSWKMSTVSEIWEKYRKIRGYEIYWNMNMPQILQLDAAANMAHQYLEAANVRRCWELAPPLLSLKQF